jgi:zona occludens toxin
MIELRTGVPGAGKTLSMVQALAKLLKSWEKKPEEGRPVFVHNVRDLALPHAPLPLLEVNHGGRVQKVPDWEAVPEGSLVIIDEAQDLFPPRSSQSAAPAHVAFLNVHRHKGIDIWVTTQHPKLVDFGLRALVGKHQHYRRLFGRKASMVYEWDACSDNLGGMKDSVMSPWTFPKNAFEFYKSAEVHTKQSFKIPRWVIIPILGICFGVYAVPRAFGTMSGAIHGKGVGSTAQGKPSGTGGAIAPTGSASAPRPAVSMASVAPVAPVAPMPPQPRVVGCIKLASRCECFGEDGARVKVEPEACEEGSHRVGGLVALDSGHTASVNLAATAAPSRPGAVPARAASASAGGGAESPGLSF